MQTLLLLFVVYFVLFTVFPLLRRKVYWVYSIVFIAVLSYLSFNISPSPTWDLYRHFETIKFYKQVGLNWILENRMDLNPLTHLYLYLFTFTDHRYFPAITVFITYFIPFYLVYKSANKFNLNQTTVFLITLFLVSNLNYLLIVSNCRLYLLYALFAYFIYMELIESKFKIASWLFYLLAPFFHYGILPLICCRLILLFRKRDIVSDLSIIIIVLLLSLGYMYLLPMLNSTVMLSSLEDKLLGYQKYTVFGTWQFLNSMTCIILVSVIAYLCYRHSRRNTIFLFYIFCLAAFLIRQLSSYQLIYRSSNFLAMIAVVPFALILTDEERLMKYRYIIINAIMIQSIYSFIYNFTYVYNGIRFDF